MRVLFSTVSPPEYMRPPRFGEEQVNCGPFFPDARDEAGRVISLSTPRGDFDLAAIAAKLPPEQAPDIVVALIDSSGIAMPRNLAAFKCPRVVLIGDTSHLESPLVRVITYVGSEPYDRRVMAYDRLHSAFLQTAGFRQLYWFPGVTFPYTDQEVQAARQRKRERGAVMIGQVGRYHPRRKRYLDYLEDRRFPVAVRQVPQAQVLRHYGKSLIGFNISINSGTNLRNFEVVAAGGMLLTDRVAPEVGFDRIFTEGREVVTYESMGDLGEKLSHYLEHPRQAAAIGAAGAAWFDRCFTEDHRRRHFQALAVDGTPIPAYAFSAEEQQRKFFRDQPGRFARGLLVYEHIQELHRQQETVVVALDPGVPADVRTMLATLARVRMVDAAPGVAADYCIAGCGGPIPPDVEAGNVWFWDASSEDAARLNRALAGTAYSPVHPTLALYRRSRSAPEDTAALASAITL